MYEHVYKYKISPFFYVCKLIPHITLARDENIVTVNQ